MDKSKQQPLSSFPDLLFRILGKPEVIPAGIFKQPISTLTDTDRVLLKRIGLTSRNLYDYMAGQTLVNFDRHKIYFEVDRALTYFLVGSALELYSEVATNYSQLQGATVWITSDSAKYTTELTKLLDHIGIEEKIFDWSWTVGAYGDLFVKMHAKPGTGIISVDDDDHPLNVSRVDHNGRLVGFFNTPVGYVGAPTATDLLPPWEYVHMRLLGAKRKRPSYHDPQYSEYRTVSLMCADTRQASSKYGTSLLLNAIPVYKRLRLAEDSVLLARLSKGLLRYLYKVKVDGTNLEAVAEIMDEYTATLKQARALDTTSGSENFDSKYNPMAVNEDIVLPVWGDAGDLSVEKLGGEPDIRWIKDVEDMRNQLAVALRVPLQLLGGFTKDLPSSLGTSALERIDIRFARASRRLQRSILDGIKRMCQIHLAYMGMDPDPALFEVNMSETSSAEEEELKDALDKGVDVVDKLSDLIAKHTGDKVDKLELLDYLNQKILKLGDLDLYSMLADMDEKRFARTGKHIFDKKEYMDLLNERSKQSKARKKSIRERIHNTDLLAHLPINSKNVNGKWPRNLNEWRGLYGLKKAEEGSTKRKKSQVSVMDHKVAPGTGWGNNSRAEGNDPLDDVMDILRKRAR